MQRAVKALEIDTPHGLARVHLDIAAKAARALVLGHGAGGGVEAVDIQAAAEVARDEGLSVALVEQPYRVAGRKAPAPAKQLDAAWLAVIAALREQGAEGPAADYRRPLAGGAGGLSDGRRSGCRGRALPGVPGPSAGEAREIPHRRARGRGGPGARGAGGERSLRDAAAGQGPRGGQGAGQPRPQGRPRCGPRRGPLLARRGGPEPRVAQQGPEAVVGAVHVGQAEQGALDLHGRRRARLQALEQAPLLRRGSRRSRHRDERRDAAETDRELSHRS